jgi:hypothetical protein
MAQISGILVENIANMHGIDVTSIVSVDGILTSNIPSFPSGSSFDSDAQAFITAAAITDPTQQEAINTLVLGLKEDIIWTKMKAIYPIIGGTASQHKYNLKDPRDLDAAFRLQFNGGITHSTNGMLPNGTNGYANTYFLPSTQIANPDSFHFSVYSRTTLGPFVPGFDIGALIITGIDNEDFANAETNAFYFIQYYGSTVVKNGLYSATASFVDTTSLGLYVGNRNSTGNITAYKNGVLKNTGSLAPSGLAYCPMLLMGASVYYPDLYPNPNDWSPYYPGKRQLAFATIGDGLSNTDNTNLYTRIQAFQTTLSRQV